MYSLSNRTMLKGLKQFTTRVKKCCEQRFVNQHRCACCDVVQETSFEQDLYMKASLGRVRLVQLLVPFNSWHAIYLNCEQLPPGNCGLKGDDAAYTVSDMSTSTISVRCEITQQRTSASLPSLLRKRSGETE